MPSALMLDTGRSKRVLNASELKDIPMPVKAEGSVIHKPIPHYELVQTLKGVLQDKGFDTVKDDYGVSDDGMRLFGIVQVVPAKEQETLLTATESTEAGMALGIRHSNDMSMSLRMIAGTNIFVCDNMAFNGDVMAMKRRHTTGLQLEQELGLAVDKVFEQYQSLNTNIDAMKNLDLTDEDAKARLYDFFTEPKAPLALPYLKQVHKWYFGTPAEQAPDCAPRTAYGLHNAFTRTIKTLPMHRTQDVTVAVTRFLSPN